MSRQLWLLRHGATEWALNGRHTGSTDLPLLPVGEAEARALSPVLSQQHFAAVFSSPLQRARRTCELAGLGDQMQICDDIIDWSYSDCDSAQLQSASWAGSGKPEPFSAGMPHPLGISSHEGNDSPRPGIVSPNSFKMK